jgi:hypothetical protein
MKTELVNYEQRRTDIFNALATRGMGLDIGSASTLAQQFANTALTPEHSDKYRLLPVELARCALFRVANPEKDRPYLEDVVFSVMASHGGGTLTYTGRELRQDDRQVLMEALYLEQQTIGVAVIKPNQFLTALGWSTNSGSRERLLGCLKRLQATSLTINVHRFPRTLSTSLIREFVTNKTDGTVHVFFSEWVRMLFNDEAYAVVVREYEQRLPKRAYLAKWLLCFYTTHAEPIPLPLAKLQTLCGDETPMKEFSRKTKDALAQLTEAGFLLNHNVAGGRVYVTRVASTDSGKARFIKGIRSRADVPATVQ